MTGPYCTTGLEIKENIHDAVIKSLDNLITPNDVFMTSSNCTTVLEVKEIIHDAVITIS